MRSFLILSDILVLLALIVANGVLSGSEIAVVTLRKTRLKELSEGGSRAARAVAKLRENPERFLATVQIGITVVGATAGAYGGVRFSGKLAPVLARLPGIDDPLAGALALGIVVVGVSYLTIVLGELVPKSLALRTAESYALFIGRPLLALAWLATPLVWFLTASSNVFLQFFGDRTNFTEGRLSSEELGQLVEEAARTGALDPRAGEIATRALDFANLLTSDVMVPRNGVSAIPRDATPDALRRILLEEGYSRMPVYEGSIDNVIGYVASRDTLQLAWTGQLIVLADLIRPAYFVPETMRAIDLLQQLQRRRLELAIVVDEQGGFAGIVTVEDLVEELVGEIFSEDEELEPASIVQEGNGSAVVLGSLAIRDVNRSLQLDLPEGDTFSTVAGLSISLAGRIPQRGERLVAPDGTVLEVVEASARRVRALRIVRPPDEPPPASG